MYEEEGMAELEGASAAAAAEAEAAAAEAEAAAAEAEALADEEKEGMKPPCWYLFHTKDFTDKWDLMTEFQKSRHKSVKEDSHCSKCSKEYKEKMIELGFCVKKDKLTEELERTTKALKKLEKEGDK